MLARLLNSLAMKVTALAGGVGGAKFLVGLDRAARDSELTAIINTGDDTVLYGVHVSPDVDIVTYWLAGIADVERGWGLQGDTFDVVDALRGLGQEAWFRLGDRDLATCIYRTERMKEGATLTEVLAETAEALGVRPMLLPMSNDRVRTLIDTRDGRTLEFQEYFVREGQRPDVKEVHFEGAAEARPAPGVLESIDDADLVIVCPSNPIVSVGPILSVEGVRPALRRHPNVVAITPIVGGAALKGPADRMLAAGGHAVSPTGVAAIYADFVDRFVIDQRDEHEAESVAELDVEPVIRDTIMSDHERAATLAQSLL